MILLDTNIIIDAHYGAINDRSRARELVSSAASGGGAAINLVTLAELYAGPARGNAIESDLARTGIAILNWPLATRDPEHFKLYFPRVKLIEPTL